LAAYGPGQVTRITFPVMDQRTPWHRPQRGLGRSKYRLSGDNHRYRAFLRVATCGRFGGYSALRGISPGLQRDIRVKKARYGNVQIPPAIIIFGRLRKYFNKKDRVKQSIDFGIFKGRLPAYDHDIGIGVKSCGTKLDLAYRWYTLHMDAVAAVHAIRRQYSRK
jgi:hypothetical protein